MTDAATPEQPRTAAWELLLAELQENPLPGARHAYTVVRDRLPKILMEAQARPAASEGLRAALERLVDALTTPLPDPAPERGLNVAWSEWYPPRTIVNDADGGDTGSRIIARIYDAVEQARAALARSESSDG